MKHYYEWGDEPTGCVSVGKYDKQGKWHDMGAMPKEEAIAKGFTFHCPWS